jgi:hypothetical protein
MRIKSCNVAVKAAGEQDGTDDGVFEAIVATWDLDSYGDKILKGAFADTLAEWKDRGDPIPVIWSHMSFDPDMHIGFVEQAEERDEGLWVKARLDLDQAKANQVYRLLKGRRVTQFSFAFDVQEGGYIEKADDDGHDEGYYELRKLKLYEVGPCLVGVNQETELLAVKAGGRDLRIDIHGKHSPDEGATIRAAVEAALSAKAGRVLSAKNETTLRDAAAQIESGRKAIQSVLAALDDDGKSRPTDPPAPAGESTDDKAKPDQPATDEDPGRGKSDRPAESRSASDVRLLADLRALGAEIDIE